jgi:large subunit ribosomal protein L21
VVPGYIPRLRFERRPSAARQDPMYAVVKTGGKQYRVAKDDVVTVERLEGEAGATVKLDQVLAIADENGFKAGTAVPAGAVVEAEIVKQARGPKIIVFKKRRRQNSRRKNGHRQDLTVLKITGIAAG